MATKTRNPIIRAFLGDEIIADSFAGGGGASSGIELALGRSPDIAINHDAQAIAMHQANHPDTRHYTESVWQVDPLEACAGKPVAFAWFSPTCTHFSKAKGTALGPEAIKQRGLAWVAVRWAHAVQPRVIAVENVEEWKDWGPIHRGHTDGCEGVNCIEGCRFGAMPKNRRNSGRIKRHDDGCPGVGCIDACDIGRPIKSRRGETFRAFVCKLEHLGYVVEHRLLKACDYGAPTSRRRLFLVARRDGKAIVWPEPTHGPGRSRPFRTAAECIDWSVPAPSIFGRAKPHADKTLARIARGVRKFVIGAARPFIVPLNHGGIGRDDRRVHSVDEPMRTITSHGRGAHAIVVPYMVHRSNGERPATATCPAQAPRIYDINSPLGTIMAQGQKHALVSAMLIKHNGGNNDKHGSSGQALDKPMDTATARDTKSLAVAHLERLDDPGVRRRAEAVYAFLVRYNGQGEPEALDKPLGTLTTKDRYGLVMVTVDGEEYVIVDIGLRMLSARELFTAQGFAPGYDITAESTRAGVPLTKTAQVRMCGNSVAPPIAAAIVRAQLGISEDRMVA